MKEIKISMGGSSRRGAMVFAILLAALGFHNLFEDIDRGRFFDSIGSILGISLAGYFALDWYRIWRGQYIMAFDSDAYQIREHGTVTATGRFDELKEIIQDGRSYTVTSKEGMQYRVLRKVMDSELVATLDSIQQKQNKPRHATPTSRPV